MTISCQECPAFSVTEANGRSIGQCGATLQVIYVGGVSPTDHLESVAALCPSYGDKPSSPPAWHSLVEPATDGQMPAESVGSCRGCVNYISANDPSVPSGFDLCGATGSLIDTERSHEGCPFAKAGIPEASPAPLLPVITTAVAITNNKAAQSKLVSKARSGAASATIIEPLEYPTDLPVDDEDLSMIKAWRAIEVGEGSKRQMAYLPIFRPDATDASGQPIFNDEDLLMIPKTGDHTHPELYNDGAKLLEAFMVDGYLCDETVCLVGEPGVGKTEFARHLAWLMQVPFYHIQFTEETLPDEIIGKTEYHPEQGTYFSRGVLPRAIDSPAVVLSDEPNTAQDSIFQQYRSFTASGQLLLDGETDPTRRVVGKHDYCVHLLAMNPTWDPRNLGTRELADADVSRLSFIWVEEPPLDVIASIIISKLEADGLSISDDELQKMMSVRADIKELSKSGALPFSWSIRQDVKVAKKLAYVEPTTAYRRALLDYCHPEAAEAVTKAVQSVFGY
jgi:MoxR-like ATPase